jgi:hypothetical protein
MGAGAETPSLPKRAAEGKAGSDAAARTLSWRRATQRSVRGGCGCSCRAAPHRRRPPSDAT